MGFFTIYQYTIHIFWLVQATVSVNIYALPVLEALPKDPTIISEEFISKLLPNIDVPSTVIDFYLFVFY